MGPSNARKHTVSVLLWALPDHK
jgi:Fe2+ or Zn2+ uptake regulation protein